jgi:hypothetical protein
MKRENKTFSDYLIKIWLTMVVTDRQGMLTPPCHLITNLVDLETNVSPACCWYPYRISLFVVFAQECTRYRPNKNNDNNTIQSL